MKSLVPFLASVASLAHAQSNFFINPGSQADQLASGNHTEDYPIYQEGDSQVFSWITNWTVISLLLYQNENASYIRLLDFEENHPNRYTYDMRPDVDLSWNDVFFLTLWNENNAEDGGPPFIYSSYFRINASDSDSSTSTSTTTTRPTSTSTIPSTTTTSTPTDSPTPEPETTAPSSDSPSDEDGGDSLSSSAKVGLGVGIGLGVPALALAGVAAFYLRRRSQAAAYQHSQQLPPGAGYTPGTGSGYPSPPVSDMSNPSPFKLGGSSTVPGYSGPVEADGTGLQAQAQAQHQSRFQELPGGGYAR
ncbi:hypothetical protein ASPCAL05618 [Aspergillus calidoustus]|uniref:Mid2 domain-containing protein n=1 Tax=Aspergillus calidoustus TaxID=454130 RepID=A0A0U5C7K8_ASPCI|nr:hypothetical protein ASPCAL05618 [Aspergillus calidoustus]